MSDTLGFASDAAQAASSSADEVPTVAFCEVVKHPQLYFDKSVRIRVTLEQAEEAQYLSDNNCPLSHDDQIGAGYVDGDEAQQKARNHAIDKIGSMEFGGRAWVTVIGVLRNVSRRDFAWYQYRFDILRFEDVSHVVVPYEGTLQAGITYQATVRGDRDAGLSLAPTLRIAFHHAVRIEWTNLDDFPALQQLHKNSREQQIVFSVLADDIKQVTETRWNRTIKCKIIR